MLEVLFLSHSRIFSGIELERDVNWGILPTGKLQSGYHAH
jgi:hypothetical protein